MPRPIDRTKVENLLDELLNCSMAEAGRRVGVSPSTPWHWLVQSRLGHPDLQQVEFCQCVAPFHVHYETNIPALTATQIQQTAFERARDGVLVDVFFQGQRMFEKVLKEEYRDIPEANLWIEVGEDWEKLCYETKPTKQWLKPSDALVIRMLESWQRKRYGSHQTIDVKYGGVLRLEKDQKPAAIEATAAQVFESEPEEEAEQRGAHLALAPPAKDSDDFEARAASGEFEQAEVNFRDADGKPAALRKDIEELRRQAAELKANGPKYKKPERPVEVGKPDAELAKEEEPLPPSTPREAEIGSGREGVGDGASPERWGAHQGFRVG